MQWSIGDTQVMLISAGAFVDDAALFFTGDAYPNKRPRRITLALNCLLIYSGSKRLLIDTGFGNKPGCCDNVEFVSGARQLVQELQARGVEPGEIDVVINTHLHADHSGGNTIVSAGGLEPAFVHAEYWIQQGEWEEALSIESWQRALYRPDDFAPLQSSGRVRWLHGDTQVTPEVRCLVVPGHTSWHQCIEVSSAGRSLLFLGDLAPTRHHLEHPSLFSAVDLDPPLSVSSRRRFCQKAVAEQSIVILAHEPAAGYLMPGSDQGEEFCFVPIAQCASA